MILRMLKYGAVGTAGLCLLGGLFFGRDAASYVWSSAKSVQTAVKDSVPIEFELQRASDLLEEIIPEMHANVRLIAAEEVEIAALKEDIRSSDQNLAEERIRVAKLRDTLNVQKVAYTLGSYDYSRQQVQALIKAQGGKPTGSVSRKTDMVIVGENPGSKLARAQELGLKTLSADDFLKMIR